MNEVTTENRLNWVSNSLCLPRDLKWAGKLENALNPSSVAPAFHPGSGASVRPCLHYSLPAPWAPTLDPLLIARVLEEQVNLRPPPWSHALLLILACSPTPVSPFHAPPHACFFSHFPGGV